MSEPAALWHELSVERPRVARLALLTCLPVRVAPELVRLARLRLVVGGGTGDEADLWLSDLVETRSSAGFSYRRAAREFLRDLLRVDTQLLDDLWNQVHLERAPWLTARARLEDELAWRLLRSPADVAINRLWEGVIEELDTVADPEGVARWIVRAVPDLPVGSLGHAAGRRAFYGASLLLGDAEVLGKEPQRFLDGGDFAFATRHLARRRIFVGLSARGLIVSGAREIENGHELDIPSTTPLWLQLEGGEAAPPEVVTITADEHTVVRRAGPVSFRTIDGALYTLERGHRTFQTGGSRRPGRVQLEYDVELYGAEKKVQLPFVIGVLSDLLGRPVAPPPSVRDRKFLQFDRDNFDSRMQQMRPRIGLRTPLGGDGEHEHQIDLEFRSMDDFRPAEVAARVEPLRDFLEARRRLVRFQQHITGNERAQMVLDEAFGQIGTLSMLAQLDAKDFPRTGLANDLLPLLESNAPDQRREIAEGVRELARQMYLFVRKEGTIWDGAAACIERLDEALSRGIDRILHHEEFQRLEAAWRGLFELVERTDTNEMLKIRVLALTKEELAESLTEDVDQGALFKHVYENEYGQFGGEPYGLLVADFYFGPTDEDVAVLERLSAVCSAAAVPVVSGASAELVGLADWSGLANVTDIGFVMSSPGAESWRRLSESPDSKFLGLAMPRFLARVPYTSTADANLGFEFKETADGHPDFVWANAAYAMAINIARAFTLYSWCTRIAGVERGGAIALPVHGFTTSTGIEHRSTETPITDRHELELSRQGLMALVSMKNTDQSVFVSARPVWRDGRVASRKEANTIALDWRWLLPASRFVHYLKCITRDTLGSFRTRAELEAYLQKWLGYQLDGEPEYSSEEAKQRHPLAVGLLRFDDHDFGVRTLRVRLLPHYQADYFSVDEGYSLDHELAPELVTRMPNVLGEGGPDTPGEAMA